MHSVVNRALDSAEVFVEASLSARSRTPARRHRTYFSRWHTLHHSQFRRKSRLGVVHAIFGVRQYLRFISIESDHECHSETILRARRGRAIPRTAARESVRQITARVHL